jgi:retinol dehydrogenase-13
MQPMIWLLKKLIMITPEKAAKSIVRLASSAEVEGQTGLYFNQLEPKEPSKLALDDELAERLWTESAHLVKL